MPDKNIPACRQAGGHDEDTPLLAAGSFIEQIAHWFQSAENDLKVAENLFKLGHYNWCLFIGHLILEKALKGLFVQRTNDVPPRIHDLLKLAYRSNISLTKQQEEFLDVVTDFNIEARYEEIKLEHYRLSSKEFTEEKFTQIKEMFEWLKRQKK